MMTARRITEKDVHEFISASSYEEKLRILESHSRKNSFRIESLKTEAQRILILSCGTGEGHNSAAFAIQEHLDGMGVYSEVVDPISFKSDRMKKRVCSAYNNLIKKAPLIFGLVYKIGTLYDNLRLPSPVYWANSRYADRLYAYIKKNHFDTVICTHIFAMEAMTAVKAQFEDIKSYGVLTDYTTIPFYKDTRLDGYFVGNENVKRQLMEKGFSSEKIIVTGIPVKKKFAEKLSKNDAKQRLGLPAEKRVIVVMSGGVGCGNQLKMCRKLDRAFGDDFVICVLCGRNEKLKSRIDAAFPDGHKIKTVSFTNDAHIYLKAADVVLSKPGGLSSTEIAVANVPFVHLKAIPGCETCNYRLFTENGLSLRGNTISKAVKAARALADDESMRTAMLEKQVLMIRSDSAQLISSHVLGGHKSFAD